MVVIDIVKQDLLDLLQPQGCHRYSKTRFTGSCQTSKQKKQFYLLLHVLPPIIPLLLIISQTIPDGGNKVNPHSFLYDK